ncbi:ABC transporter substrate-binding protein [Paenibacillus sabinae]|uniref:Family 1 extracellular solute-binding protein n=1 Tax=Paenibacillus sabinae T27 TaxID=1268072 RepID=X4ZD14_9BACL|nr:extracellular solute-binding protein [Paenibacillus sabinae]AHV95387.1 family 1 extracellular solute-binding protein [Paenibacillus sabinae T27]
MKRYGKWLVLALSLVVLTAIVSACGGGSNTGSAAENGSGAPANEGKKADKKTYKWFVARGVDSPPAVTVKEIADEFSKTHPEFELVLEGTGDRPSYLQKLRTLIASNEMPAMFDTDPDAYASKLVEKGKLVDMKKLLQDLGKYDAFRPVALQYQQFADGSMYTLPIEYGIEVFWYNIKMFKDLGLQPPKTFDEFLKVAETLKQNGITPIAVDGKDKWPVLRYLAFEPFRMTGNDFIENVKQGKASFKDPAGMAGINLVHELGTKGYFQQGFSSTDYTAARDLFLAGKTGIYYMGSWETMNFANDKLSADMKDNIGFFRLPMMEGAKTAENDYFINSGIGVAFNKETFDDTMKEFVKFLLEKYPEAYTKKGQFSPFNYSLDQAQGMPEVFYKIQDEIAKSGSVFAVPWDTRLDPATNELLGNELNALALGAHTPDDFADLMDQAIKENAPKYFK